MQPRSWPALHFSLPLPYPLLMDGQGMETVFSETKCYGRLIRGSADQDDRPGVPVCTSKRQTCYHRILINRIFCDSVTGARNKICCPLVLRALPAAGQGSFFLNSIERIRTRVTA